MNFLGRFKVYGELYQKIQKSLVNLALEENLALIQEGIKKEVPAYEMITDGLYEGMKTIGTKFEEGEYFIPELMFAAHITNKAIELLKPHLKTEFEKSGSILIGTVSGDLHDIGKNIVSTILKVNGIKVYDLGVDVPNELWIQKIKELNPNIVGLSCLMAASISSMRNVIQEIEKNNLRQKVKIIVGGGALSKTVAEQIGADAYAYDAMNALKIINEMLD